jgi:hypothetical protein
MKHNPKKDASKKALLILRTQASEVRAQEALEALVAIEWPKTASVHGVRVCDTASAAYKDMLFYLADQICFTVSTMPGLVYPRKWMDHILDRLCTQALGL